MKEVVAGRLSNLAPNSLLILIAGQGRERFRQQQRPLQGVYLTSALNESCEMI